MKINRSARRQTVPGRFFPPWQPDPQQNKDSTMKKQLRYFSPVLIMCFFLSACAEMQMEFNTAEKTAQLRPGMMHKEVIGILGKPKSVQFIGDKVVLKYSLHEYWKGWVPYYVIFEKRTGKLQEWYADEAEYQQNQAMWMATFKNFEQQQETSRKAASLGESGNTGTYMEGYDPNANYYTDDYYWEGSGFHYDDQ